MAPLLVSLLLQAVAAGAPAQSSPPASETVAEEFRRIGEELYENENPFIGAGPRRELERALENPALEDVKRVDLLIMLGKELLKGLDVALAVEKLEEAAKLSAGRATHELQVRLHRQLALAYLRLAE